jgi:CDP-diacylglycerol--glycerol-3-phosphate 3-phosphatidyltransferase
VLNLPTIVTLSRILLIPGFVFVVEKEPLTGVIIFSIASATDILDGYLARKRKEVTRFGVLLDPIADKLLVISALILLVDINLAPAWIAIVIIVREFLVTGLRLIALSRDIVISAEFGGKIKTAMQITAIIILFLSYSTLFSSFGISIRLVGTICLWIAMLIGLISGCQYFVLFYKKI